MDIIQHHAPYDFAAFFEKHESKYINLDLRDFETFMGTAGEKHSFIDVSDTDADNRIQNLTRLWLDYLKMRLARPLI